jgi:DNA-binding NarL/FixJ family response regulator
MILIAVDDLLFSSKIRTAAKHAGAEIAFVRTSAEILRQARAAQPSAVVFDLNSERTDPVGTIRSMKADPDLEGITVIGFVSHVRADLVSAAREAGADEVMARSAFAERLGEILQRQ